MVSEIGVNHNGSLDKALFLIKDAQEHGADAVKFQKRTVELCVPKEIWDAPRKMEDGSTIPYIDYKHKMEFGRKEYDQIDAYCQDRGIPWFASVWDEGALEFMEWFDPVAYKIGSASLTDAPLVQSVVKTGKPIIASTGMSTWHEIEAAMMFLQSAHSRLVLCHCTSIYPLPANKVNLRMLETLQRRWPKVMMGYSGHERGVFLGGAAIALGASYVERHFTDNRFAWGSDQAASLEGWQLHALREAMDKTWLALGDGNKVVYDEEKTKMAQLRRSLFAEV